MITTNRKKILLVVISLVIIAPCSGIAQDRSVSIDNIKRHIKYLGSDLFEGRGTGTTGGNLSAKYIALQFEEMNLQPMGDNGTFYQYVPMHGSTPLLSSELKIYTTKDTSTLKLNEDYLLYKSGDQTFIPNPLPVAFVGYGIIAPEFDYNDYESIDVEGKIVVMLEGEPSSTNDNYFDGKLPTIYSYPESKRRIALARGARGSVIIPNTSSSTDWKKLRREFLFEDITLAYSVTSNLSVLLNPAEKELLFSGSSISFDDILDMHNENRMESFDLNVKLSFEGEFSRRDFLSPNVLGMISGRDAEKQNEYVIVSAHYDHLGIGESVNGDSVYNGVFDNALGVATVIELARELNTSQAKPDRSIIFLLVTGEEKGLLGSTYYTDHPIVPLYKTIANINVDGVPYIDEFNSIVGVGNDLSELEDYLSDVTNKMGLKVIPLPGEFSQTESFNRSDQIAFAKAGIPSLLVLDGPDYKNILNEEGMQRIINYSENIYHTPFDDLSQKINYKAVDQFNNLMIELIETIANTDEEINWYPGVQYSIARLRSIAEKK